MKSILNEITVLKRICGIFALAAALLWAGAAPVQGYVWQEEQAAVTTKGDLVWTPEAFVYEPGPSIRYIDYDGGNDNNNGQTTSTAWKHHPWDPAATGVADGGSGNYTYVFKRGVIYRGILTGSYPSMTDVRLTSDPSWGTGEAVLAGSQVVSGWEIAGTNAPTGMPNVSSVWRTTSALSYFPRRVWAIDGNGVVTRLKLARTPNWTESNPDDVMSQWWYWQNPNWWQNPCPHKITVGGTIMHLGIDTTHITQAASYYTNALVWTEWGIVMGTPFASTVEAVDMNQKGLGFQGVWYGDSGTLMRGCRYFLEDKPHYLDEAGEFWADPCGSNGARLYVRMPGDQNPSFFTIEAASRVGIIDLTGGSNIKISGLTFAYNNVYRDLTARFFVHNDVDGAAVRLQGTGRNITVNNCKFEQVNMAVRFKAVNDTDQLDNISIRDNEITETDQGGILVSDSSRWSKFMGTFGPLKKVEVLRNRLHNIGQRTVRSEMGPAIEVDFADNATVAGNILTRAHGAGLFLFGGKGSGESRDKPFSRLLIFQNKVEDSLLKANDWGGIETWQGGPTYMFNNISGNPRGFWHWTWLDKSASDKLNTESGFGHAYYLDGAFKVYVFNNIAWGKSSAQTGAWTASAFQVVLGIHDQFFNNSAHQLNEMERRQGVQGGRVNYIGNVFVDFPFWGYYAESDGVSNCDINTLAFTQSVHGGTQPASFGKFEPSGTTYTNMNNMKSGLGQYKAYASDVGVTTTAAVTRNIAGHDFRPTPSSAALERGMKVFVPWALCRNVGEWHFRRFNENPALVDDDHWYMATYYTKRDDYWKVPRFPLTGVNIGASDYFVGPLEDWCMGALRLNGTSQYLYCTDATMKQSFTYTQVDNSGNESPVTISGDQIWSPNVGTEGFVLEAVLRASAGSTGLLMGKMNSTAGWRLEIDANGCPKASLKVGGTVAASFVASSLITNGDWHHLVVDVNRTGGGIRMWVDGASAAGTLTGSVPASSLANTGDLLVGGGPGETYLACELEFLRVARGTLEDAQTTAAELYEWEFHGPFLADFFGNGPRGARRDAGAIEEMRTDYDCDCRTTFVDFAGFAETYSGDWADVNEFLTQWLRCQCMPCDGHAAPTVNITTPTNGAVYTLPVSSITMAASASSSSGFIIEVEFFANGVSLGKDYDSTGPGGWSIVWKGLTAGTYQLTARAVDNLGAATTSDPITITINNP